MFNYEDSGCGGIGCRSPGFKNKPDDAMSLLTSWIVTQMEVEGEGGGGGCVWWWWWWWWWGGGVEGHLQQPAACRSDSQLTLEHESVQPVT